jgi:7-carboxy-7-deazaguanine synthase
MKSSPVAGSTLPVMEQFYTLQGEGFHQGKAAYFIRLGGCDVGCVWCDVKESWDASRHPSRSVASLIEEIKKTAAEIVVITGGEPLMYDLTELTQSLQQSGYKTHLETSGAYSLSGYWNWICVSPKKFKSPLPEVLSKADELKVIIFNRSDFDWAEKHMSAVKPSCKLYLQPEWEKAAEMTPLIIEFIKSHPRWELSLQIHKYINVP